MPKKNSPNITIRPTDEDRKLIAAFRKRLGVDVSQIIRLALRALAAKEGMTA
jgi:antitoxin component of RelBE/YafQ-DinJ toxin-antitoxin module